MAEWFNCGICGAKKYCSKEEFQNHREDCEYKNGERVVSTPLDPSTHDCPKCGGSVTRVGTAWYCAACGVVIGGGSAIVQ